MINLQRLEYIKEHSADNSLSFVVDYILQKIQRDKSEFSRYSYEEDWSELDKYINKIKNRKTAKDLNSIQQLICDISESDEELVEDNSFEKTLMRHLHSEPC